LRGYERLGPSKSLSSYNCQNSPDFGKQYANEELKHKEKIKTQKNLIFRLTNKTFYNKRKDDGVLPRLTP
jgi:hypothetical protein